jgi:RimJ/RimL family protein N-acetyltransferase
MAQAASLVGSVIFNAVNTAGEFAVSLVEVNELILGQLASAAITDASASEVTAPVTTENEWSPTRIAWLLDFHRTRRDGLNGPAGEITWAILLGDQVVGSVRLKQTAVPGILETGIWLIRHIRGQGVGRHAMIEMLQRAAALGALGVRADTTTSNRAALASCDISTSTWCPLMMVQGSRPS